MQIAERQTILSSGYRLGCYQIENFLGQGGFGVTYLAHDCMLDLSVAIKEYMPESLAIRKPDQSVHPISPESAVDFNWGLRSFIKEAQTLAKFRHPNIVRVMSVLEHNGTAYMVMEYESGQDLKAILSCSGTLTQRRLEQIIGPIADGLEEVHRHGYIHRDIKPANIRIRNDGTPVLLDFGSARQAVESHTSVLTALVSAGYAPLEQYTGVDGNQQGPWTDIYALGAVLYFAVTGDAPTDSALRASALLNDRPDPLVNLTRKNPTGYSPAFCRAIDWALGFKVAQRPQTIEQWRVQLLGEFASGQTAHEQRHAEQPSSIKRNELPDLFFIDTNRHVSHSEPSTDDSLFRKRTLGPDDPTVVDVRPLEKPANTSWLDRSFTVGSTSKRDQSSHTPYIGDRPVPTLAEAGQIVNQGAGVAGNFHFKKRTALFIAAGLFPLLLVLVFSSLLSFDNNEPAGAKSVEPEVVDRSVEAISANAGSASSVIDKETEVPAFELPFMTQSVPSNMESDHDTVKLVGAISDQVSLEAEAITISDSVVFDNAAQARINQALARAVQANAEQADNSQALVRAVQAAGAKRQLKIEKGRLLKQ